MAASKISKYELLSILSAKLGLYRVSGCEEDLDFTPKERRDAEDLGDS